MSPDIGLASLSECCVHFALDSTVPDVEPSIPVCKLHGELRCEGCPDFRSKTFTSTVLEHDDDLIVKALRYYAKNHPRLRARARKELRNWVEPKTEQKEPIFYEEVKAQHEQGVGGRP